MSKTPSSIQARGHAIVPAATNSTAATTAASAITRSKTLNIDRYLPSWKTLIQIEEFDSLASRATVDIEREDALRHVGPFAQ
jgi:hypothetical protein